MSNQPLCLSDFRQRPAQPMRASTLAFWSVLLFAVVGPTFPCGCWADEASALRLLKSLGAREQVDNDRENKPVVSIAMAGSKINDEVIESVIELKHLERLNLMNTQITDEGVKRLSALSELRTLILYGCSISEEGLLGLTGLTHLESLDLQQTKAFMSKSSKPVPLRNLKTLALFNPVRLNLAGIVEMSGLQEISITGGAGPGRQDINLTKLKELKNLRTLNLYNFPEMALSRLSEQAPEIESLSLAGGGFYMLNDGHVITGTGIEYLKPLAKLRSLDLSGRVVNVAGLEKIGELSELTSLTLVGCAVSDAQLEHFKHLKSLTLLNVSHTSVTAAGVEELRAALPKTNVIFQAAPATTPEAKAAAKELGKLGAMFVESSRADTGARDIVFVILTGKKIADEDLVHLKALPELNAVDLSQTDITDRGLEILSTISKLRVLKLNDTKVTERGLEQLPKLNDLYTLELARVPITDAVLKKLQDIKKLSKLTIEGKNISAESLAELKSKFPKLSLTVLTSATK